jgi:malic enzyme
VPTFNDDIQATAAVAVAAVLGGVQVPGVLPLTQQRWLFFGAGQVSWDSMPHVIDRI